MKIKNYGQLLSYGDIAARRIVLEIVEKSLQSLDSYTVIKNLVQLNGDSLRIGKHSFNLGNKRRVFVIGAGKASNAMARALDDILGALITKGIVIAKKLETDDDLKHIELLAGGHPLPNHNGLKASKRILNIVDRANPEDLFISVISGGSSALMSCPVSGISVENEIEITDQLIKSGARIQEINAVRRHISETNGGRLAQKIEKKGAELINFIISDSVGDKEMVDPEKSTAFWGTPVAPDQTTLQDGRDVLKKYDLLTRAPKSILDYLWKDDLIRETPKSFSDRVHNFVLRGSADSCETVLQTINQMGIAGMVITSLLEGESREAGTFLATIAKEIILNHRPIAPPCVLIAGGETTTTIKGPSGQGGPSQELALSFALEIQSREGICVAAIDTDGTDGPTDFAGGIADGYTVGRAQAMGLDVYASLTGHDSSRVLTALGDEVVTGNTGTNVCNVNVIYVG